MVFFLHLLILGVAIGAIYSLIALGFVLVYKSTRVLNFTQGTLVMLGAFIIYALLEQISLPIFLALPLSLAVAIGLGFLIERLVLRPMIGEPLLSVVMVTIGLASVLKGGAIIIWTTEYFSLPKILPTTFLHLGPVTISPPYLWGFIVSMLLIIILTLFFKFTNLGIAMRAVANDQGAALSMGISVKWVFGLSWALAGLVATVGGFFLGAINIININLDHAALPLFAVVILGGMDSMPGAIIAGVLIAVLQNFAGGYLAPILGGGIKAVAPFLVLLIVLMIKPYGLFGTVEVERL